ncbi:MAG: tryptophan 2,3-dioxygenase family protein [Acidobacteriota bacterium]
MSTEVPQRSFTYSSYLRLDELLALQSTKSDEHDETLFIVIHQVYELWFKQILHELDHLATLFLDHQPPEHSTTHPILHTLERVLTVLKTMVAQVDILETMTPTSFSSFRDRLSTASGFQSPQFREFEILLGERRRARGMLRHHDDHPPARDRIAARMARISVYQAFLRYVQREGYELPEEIFAIYEDGPPPEHPRVREILIEIYRNDDRIRLVAESLVDLDEGLQEWRYRHVKMVERTIGAKVGTGGSAGAEYLRRTLFQPIFPDLWTIRSEL